MEEPKRTKLTDEHRAHLRAELARTGQTLSGFIRQLSDTPKSITLYAAQKWFSGGKTAKTSDLKFVIDALAALPSVTSEPGGHLQNDDRLEGQRRLGRRAPTKRPLQPMELISRSQRDALTQGLKRSGIQYSTLMTLLPIEFSGISRQIIQGWANGTTQKARPSHIGCVLEILNSLSDTTIPEPPFSQEALDASHEARTNPAPPTKPPKKKARVIEPKAIKKVRKVRIADPAITTPRKSDLGGRKVFPDLDKDRWIKKRPWTPIEGTSTHIRIYPKKYTSIDEHTYERLHAELRRTCVSPPLLLKSFKSAPPSLPSRRISEWMRLVTRSGEKALIDWVLKAYALLPDAPKE